MIASADERAGQGRFVAITIDDYPRAPVETTKGRLTYIDWLKQEAHRLHGNDIDARIREEECGTIALFRRL